jgi:hypothetical protein
MKPRVCGERHDPYRDSRASPAYAGTQALGKRSCFGSGRSIITSTTLADLIVSMPFSPAHALRIVNASVSVSACPRMTARSVQVATGRRLLRFGWLTMFVSLPLMIHEALGLAVCQRQYDSQH